MTLPGFAFPQGQNPAGDVALVHIHAGAGPLSMFRLEAGDRISVDLIPVSVDAIGRSFVLRSLRGDKLPWPGMPVARRTPSLHIVVIRLDQVAVLFATDSLAHIRPLADFVASIW